MAIQPVHINLDLTPRSRFELINVASKISEVYGDLLENYRRIACSSFHTTAGYLEQQSCAKFDYSCKRLKRFIGMFQELFPPNAGYFHDTMELRKDLNESKREREPANADSHLTFISAGLKNCVTYANNPRLAIYFIDLDGVHKHDRRSRRTTILAYNKEDSVYHGKFWIPVCREHPIISLNLKDPHYGLFPYLYELLDFYEIDQGLIDIRLAREERHAALTVNEYETLLMRNDLPDAMSNPLRYIFRRGKNLLQNPASIPVKARCYAVFDLVHLYNELIKNIGIGRSVFDKALSYLSSPVCRIFQLKRKISMLVSSRDGTGPARIVQGTYQSPILLQHQTGDKGVRCLEITLKRFE